MRPTWMKYAKQRKIHVVLEKSCAIFSKIEAQTSVNDNSFKYMTTVFSDHEVHLTRWLPAYGIFVLRFRPKNSSFRLPYQRPSSSADCARELFNGSNGSASLVDCTRKKFLVGGVDCLLLTS